MKNDYPRLTGHEMTKDHPRKQSMPHKPAARALELLGLCRRIADQRLFFLANADRIEGDVMVEAIGALRAVWFDYYDHRD